MLNHISNSPAFKARFESNREFKYRTANLNTPDLKELRDNLALLKTQNDGKVYTYEEYPVRGTNNKFSHTDFYARIKNGDYILADKVWTGSIDEIELPEQAPARFFCDMIRDFVKSEYSEVFRQQSRVSLQKDILNMLA